MTSPWTAHCKNVGRAVETIQAPGGPALSVRTFAYHPKNAQRVWRGNESVMAFIDARRGDLFEGRRLLELGAATGLLSIFLAKRGLGPLTTSDCATDGEEVRENIAHK